MKAIHTLPDGTIEELDGIEDYSVERGGPKAGRGLKIFGANRSRARRHFAEDTGGIVAIVSDTGVEIDVYNV